MAERKVPSTVSNQPSSRRRSVLIIALVGLSVAGTFALVILTFGGVSGTEFSPTHFQSRTFTVREVPWLRMQISPIRRTASQLSTSQYLVAQSLIQPPKGSPSVWHLVGLSRGAMQESPADAKLLTDQLELAIDGSTGGNAFWHDWSIREPAKAKVLWQTVQKLAIRELYILLPTIFASALDAKDDTVLRRSIDDYLRTSYHELVMEMRSTGRTELASELLAEAILDFPDDAKLQELR
jgi:hypothetical protein